MNYNGNDPLGSALADAAEVRVRTREKVVIALSGSGGRYAAEAAHRESQQLIGRHRARAVAAAKVVVDRECRRMFASQPANVWSSPERDHHVKVQVEVATKSLKSEEDAAKALDECLRWLEQGDNLYVAGGIAQKAMEQGWEQVLGTWVSSQALGAQRGGWATISRIRDAQKIVDGELPFMLADLPSLQHMAASMNLSLGGAANRPSTPESA